MWDRVWTGGPVATMDPDRGSWGLVEDGAVASKDGRIAWVGARRDLPGRAESLAQEVVDLGGCWLTPGLVDCHTHLVYGGNRAQEFALRLEGATYQEIAAKGGGIVSTVRATRDASYEELRRSALRRLEPLLAEGVTTIEVKSGYGLDIETEAKQLAVARSLANAASVTVSTTYLGLHALPPEYAGRKADFVEFVIAEGLPAIAGRGLADAVDAFCETIAFTADETARCFEAARAFKLPVKLHADQLSDTGGAALAARFGGLSADHVEYAATDGIRAMAAAGTVAVILPAAFYYLRETKAPPIAEFRRASVPMAVASDINPGTAPVGSLLLMANMASTLFRMTPEEAFAGLTREAAKALGMGGERGTIAPGRFADFAIFDIGHPVELAYSIGGNPCVGVVKEGQPVRGLGAASQGGY